MSADVEETDPITLEVIRGGLLSIGDELSSLMMGAGGFDLSTGVCDADGHLVAAGQSFVHPVQLGALPVAVAATFARIPPSSFAPGDVVISNDVFTAGGSHLPDILLLAPVFVEGDRVAFLGARTHWMDIGGNTPGSLEMINAREIFGDGLRIPPIKIRRGGQLDEDMLDLITLNTRNSDMRRLDFSRQLGSLEIGLKRIQGLCEKYGKTVFGKALDISLDYTERRLREFIRALPDGEYSADDWVEIEGIRSVPLRLSVTLTVDGDEIVADLSKTDPQLPLVGFNAPLGPTTAMILYAIKCVAGPEIPMNGAFERVVKIVAPPGSVLNALPPAACGGVAGGTELASRLTEVVIAALAQAAPERVVASCGSHVLFSVHGIDPDPDRRKLFGRDAAVSQLLLGFEVHRSGYGARPTLDGVTSISAYIGNDHWLSCEELETRSPLQVTGFEIRNESAGWGRTRGGFGSRRSYDVLADDVAATFLTGHSRSQPYGLDGGQAGLPARVTVRSETGGDEIAHWAGTTALRRGMHVTIETAGGGGFGPPWERPVDAVLGDVAEGYVSAQTADEVFGVVLTEAGEVDVSATEVRRSLLRQADRHSIDRGTEGPYADIDPALRHRWSQDSPDSKVDELSST